MRRTLVFALLAALVLVGSLAAINAVPQQQQGIFIFTDDTGTHSELGHALNALDIALAYDVHVNVRTCGSKDAYYDPQQNTILICEEFADTVSDDALTFIVYHEVAHSLIDMYKLPFTGREEDVADQFATTMLIEQREYNAVQAGAQWYHNRGGKRYDWDDHSFDDQRYYNIMCWLYGSDEAKFASLPADTKMDKQRAEQCGTEFIRMTRGWDSLLAAHQ